MSHPLHLLAPWNQTPAPSRLQVHGTHHHRRRDARRGARDAGDARRGDGHHVARHVAGALLGATRVDGGAAAVGCVGEVGQCQSLSVGWLVGGLVGWLVGLPHERSRKDTKGS